MNRSASKRISYLPSAVLIAGVLLNLCSATAGSLRLSGSQPQQEVESFASVAGGAHSQALTNGPRAHTDIPASKQKRVRHPALDFTALPPESFQLSSASLGRRAFDRDRFAFCSSFSIRPQGRAPPTFL